MQQQPTQLTRLFTGIVSAAGITALAYSVHRLYLAPARLDWLLYLVVMVLLTWRAEVLIPGARSKVTLTDPFIYLGALLLGPWVATVLATLDVLMRSPRDARRLSTIGTNIAASNLAILGATQLAMYLFGPLDLLVNDSARVDNFISALGVIALVSYLINTLILAVSVALRRRREVVRTWADSYIWISSSYFIGMLAAGIMAKAIAVYGFYSFAIALPILLLTWVTYKNYFARVEASNRHIETLSKLHLATIESLTLAIDAKDPMTRGHIQRVRLLAEGLAWAVGYPEEQMEGLKAAALLHDIGKLAVPEHILSKPGPLSSAEFAKVMIHPAVAADILSNVEFPYEVVPIVKHHHEKYDGTGYPSRLKGDEIPLGARILTTVDCYEALTSSRPYRGQFTRKQALELMKRDSGGTFDPSVLKKFLSIVDELEASLPVLSSRPLSLDGIEPLAGTSFLTDSGVLDTGFVPCLETRTEKALRDISAAQGEVLSLYEISQTLASTLKLTEVLPIVAAKLENIANFTTLIIYLAEGNRLRAAYAIGKHAEAIKGSEMLVGEGSAGWVCEHRQMLIGGSPLIDLVRPLGQKASAYRTSAIFPLMQENTMVGSLALYSEDDCGYSADEVRLLETVSAHAASALQNALTFERTQKSALTDNLTGLPNSRFMYSFFDQERSRAERHGYALVLMMMDLDGFKKINDTYGHHIGDDILRHVASIARAQLRTGDTLIRYAGDEFVAVLHRATPDVVQDVKSRLQSAIDRFAHEVRPGRVARVGISIGYATYNQDGLAIDELMEVADQRMYEDKMARKRPQSGPLAVLPAAGK